MKSSGKKILQQRETFAKVKNKQANKAKRKSYRHEKEIKRAQRSKQYEENPLLSAELGIRAVFDVNSKKAKKLEEKRKRKASEEKRQRFNEERHAPVSAGSAADVLRGKIKAKDSAVQDKHNIPKLTPAEREIQELKERAARARELESKRKQLAEEDDDDDEDDESGFVLDSDDEGVVANDSDIEYDDDEEELQRPSKKARREATPQYDNDDDDDDDEEEESASESEEEEELIQPQQNTATASRKKTLASFTVSSIEDINALAPTDLVDKPKPLPQRVQAQLRAQGKDPAHVMNLKLTQWKKAVERKREELIKEFKIENNIVSDEELDSDEEDVLSRMVNLWDNEELENEDFSSVKVLELEKKERAKQRRKERQERAALEAEGVVLQDKSDASGDDDDEENVFDDLTKDDEKSSSSSSKSVSVAQDGSIVDDAKLFNEVVTRELLRKQHEEEQARKKAKMMVLLEDGTWGVRDDGDDAKDGEGERKEPVEKANLEKYVRKPVEKVKKTGVEHIESDPRKSDALSAMKQFQQEDLATQKIEQSLEQFRKARLARLRQVQIIIADLCQEILLSPEKYLIAGHGDALLGLCKDTDKTVRQLAFVSLTKVFMDIIPGYRIHIPSAAEKKKEAGITLSKEVARLRKYESCLVELYHNVLIILMRMVRQSLNEYQKLKQSAKSDDIEENNIGVLALKCLCQLFERNINFNYSRELASFMATLLTCASPRYQDMVAECVTRVFKKDIAGDATLEIVQSIANVFKKRGGEKTKAPLLMVLLALPLNREILNAKVADEKTKKNTKQLAKGAGSHYWVKLQQEKEEERYRMKKAMKSGKEYVENTKNQRRAPKEVDERQLKRDLAESDATVSIKHRKKNQTEILSLVFTIYFRFLKQAPTLKTLYEDNAQSKVPVVQKDANGNVRETPWKVEVTELPSHLVLQAVLKGISQFAYLINIDLVLDLLEHLKLVVGASSKIAAITPSSEYEIEQKTDIEKVKDKLSQAKVESIGALPIQSSLLCIYTAFLLLKMHCNALNIDVHPLYAHFYELIWQLIQPEDSKYIYLVLECWDLMILQSKNLPIVRVAALCRRMLLISNYLKPNYSIPIIHAVGLALSKYPRAGVFFENDGQTFTGKYDEIISDPDLSHATGSPSWDMTLLVQMYHPYITRILAHMTCLPEIISLYTKTDMRSWGKILVNGEEAKSHEEIKKTKKMRHDEDDELSTFNNTNIPVEIAGERCLLSRLTPLQLLQALDCSKGTFAPDIQEPLKQYLAITYPEQVSTNIYKQAISKAIFTRRSTAGQKFYPYQLLPTYAADVCVGSEPEEIYTEELPTKKYPGLQVNLGVNLNTTIKQWITQPLCLDTQEEFSFARRVQKQRYESILEKNKLLRTLCDAYYMSKAIQQEEAENQSLSDMDMSELEEDVMGEFSDFDEDDEDTMQYDDEDDDNEDMNDEDIELEASEEE